MDSDTASILEMPSGIANNAVGYPAASRMNIISIPSANLDAESVGVRSDQSAFLLHSAVNTDDLVLNYMHDNANEPHIANFNSAAELSAFCHDFGRMGASPSPSPNLSPNPSPSPSPDPSPSPSPSVSSVQLPASAFSLLPATSATPQNSGFLRNPVSWSVESFRAPEGVPTIVEPQAKRKRVKRKVSTGFVEKRKADLPTSDEKESRRLRHSQRLLYRGLASGIKLIGDGLGNGLHPTTTGWEGSRLGSNQQMKHHIASGEVWNSLARFRRVPYSGEAVFVFDEKQRLLILRLSQTKWHSEIANDLLLGIQQLVQDSVNNNQNQLHFQDQIRGEHFPCLLGHFRQSMKLPQMVPWHKKNLAKAQAFIESSAQRRLTGFVNQALQLYCPGCYERFSKCVQYHEIQPKPEARVTALFGVFFNLCINVPFPNGLPRVHLFPHTDRKNIAGGYCALYVYTGNEPFRHKEKGWLVIWEAGLILEVPEGVLLFYPSALFYHFNVDIHDIVSVTRDGSKPDISKRNSYPLNNDGAKGRASIVWFNEASMLQTSETGYSTLIEARRARKSTTTDFEVDSSKCFTVPVPSNLLF
ncbi:hypothetical protein BJ138DRAFT_1118826 [Hygrophoropsis aurantiaca]|uniref:Uncharacterized protein n=1 Tax=Hygrophoropsis aurantiaca TaxID=72124 RepID=A0ACB7ZVU6_9AGAM|nr:hypothetical protein BJ138DRAFT_1118826 [Hygrophoropsis aurantiaca]